MTKQSKINNQGFTLAEVLITLSIIGVVAAMTIPALQQNLNEAQYKVAFKKSYAVFSQAAARLIQENGSLVFRECANDLGNCYADKFKPYLNVQKTCTNSTKKNCFVDISPNSIKNFQGSFLTSSAIANSPFQSWMEGGYFMLNDGTSMALTIRLDSPNIHEDYGYAGVDAGGDVVGAINVDTNGLKAPNTIGKDINTILIFKDRLKPMDKFGCDRSSTDNLNGFGCAQKIIMNEDY